MDPDHLHYTEVYNLHFKSDRIWTCRPISAERSYYFLYFISAWYLFALTGWYFISQKSSCLLQIWVVKQIGTERVLLMLLLSTILIFLVFYHLLYKAKLKFKEVYLQMTSKTGKKGFLLSFESVFEGAAYSFWVILFAIAFLGNAAIYISRYPYSPFNH